MDTPKLIGPPPLALTRLSEPTTVTAFAQRPELSGAEASASLAHFLRILRKNAWKLFGFVAVLLAASLYVSIRMEKLYESTATVKVDRHPTRGVVGQEASQVLPDNDVDQIITTQLEQIQSDSVLRPVAEKYHLLEVEKQLAGLTADQATRRMAAPVVLERLKVTRPPNTYLIKITYRAYDPKLAADVANSVAASFVARASETRNRAHTEVKALINRELTGLRAKMEASSQALAEFEGRLNMVDPQQPKTMLISRLTQLNTELTVAQTERLHKEAVLNSVSQNPTIAAEQASAKAETLERAIERLNGARQQFATTKIVYGENHLEYRKASSQVAELEAQVEQLRKNTRDRLRVEYEQALDREQRLRTALDETKADVDAQSGPVLQYLQLERDADNDKKLYEDLVRRTEEADINNQFQDAVVQIAQSALPADKHVFPNLPLNLGAIFVLSSILGVIAVVVLDALDTTLWDPEEAARRLNVDVLAVVPVAKNLPKPQAFISKIGMVKGRRQLADSAMNYADAIRGLRTAIHVTKPHRPIRSIMLTSANPNEGKSTTAAHLATCFAEIGKKVLLVDADLRRPTVHAHFDSSNDKGLSDVLMGKIPVHEAIIPIETTKLSVMPAGRTSLDASDLIAAGISDVLAPLHAEFEMIIIDAPSILGCPESQQMAGLADSVVVVVKARSTTDKELAVAVSTLHHAHANIIGLVMNQMKRSDRTAYGYYPPRYADYARR